ncbi:glycoside hydrolase family 47 protein [Xylariales sp. PMI_506]|nr:glycoside hydrolase family 47 protein [Xylariales sp. PMI_506]
MLSSTKVLSLVGLLPYALAAPSGTSGGSGPTYESHPDRLAAVQEAFDRAWAGYYTYAFPHDSLLPISVSFTDDYGGWGASAVDALSTALIIGDQTVVDQILDYVPTINFAVSNNTGSVSLFETTIRYLGGLLSAHDLLTGPRSDFVTDQSQVDAILTQATKLADLLSVAFDTPSGVPINDIAWNPPRPLGDTTNGLATIGSLVMEWMRLSDKTGNTTYAELAQKGESYLLNPKPVDIAEPFPGLLGTDVNISDGTFIDSDGWWGGGDDSFYEYLIKMYVYDTSRFSTYKDRWVLAVDSSIKYLTSHPTTRPDLTFFAGWENADELLFEDGHLNCFYGGNFILGGLTLNNQKYIDVGLALTDACHATYTATVSGIGPEEFEWQDSKTPTTAANNPGPPAAQAAFYEKSGFWISDFSYDLRPEVIESFYYAWRATGNSTYQDWAWDAFLNINASCSVGVGFGGLYNVNELGGNGNNIDHQESFFFAEVLKYSYLIQSGEEPWHVSATHNNTFVFNTEAHPMKVVGTPI